MSIGKIVSGGQTGADRAALDAAMKAKFQIGGWVPAGRSAEDGVISLRYPNLIETPSSDVAERTRKNVLDSDATLIVSHGPIAGGTKLTMNYANEIGRPLKLVDLGQTSEGIAVEDIRSWLETSGISTLNVAGPRASEDPGIYDAVFQLITRLLTVHERLAAPEDSRRPPLRPSQPADGF